MSLFERVRRGSECATWVINEVAALERENAKLREELAKDQFEYKLCDTSVSLWKERAEAAEAKLKAASGQEPCGYVNENRIFSLFVPGDFIYSWKPVYAAPIPPAEVQELLAQQAAWRKFTDEANNTVAKAEERIAELERMLEEQQARGLNQRELLIECYNKITGHRNGDGTFDKLDAYLSADNVNTEELNILLAQAREEGRKEAVPDGWQVVPKEDTIKMIGAGGIAKSDGEFIKSIYAAMLASAPKPGGKE